jgi:hypothetical protein
MVESAEAVSRRCESSAIVMVMFERDIRDSEGEMREGFREIRLSAPEMEQV